MSLSSGEGSWALGTPPVAGPLILRCASHAFLRVRV